MVEVGDARSDWISVLSEVSRRGGVLLGENTHVSVSSQRSQVALVVALERLMYSDSLEDFATVGN